MLKTLNPRTLTLWTIAGALLFWCVILTLKYTRLDYTGWDQGLYAQLMWSLAHGTTHTSLFGGSFLIDHANHIAFFLTPLFWILPAAPTLLALKVLALGAAAWLIFLLTDKKLGGWWGLVLTAGYLFYPANMAMMLFEFNFENLAVPLILLTFYFIEEQRLIAFFISATLLCLVKENMPPVVVMFGLYNILKYWHNKKALILWAGIPLLFGTLTFIVVAFLTFPLLTSHVPSAVSHYWEYYQALGNTPSEILRALVLDPGKILSLIFTGKNMAFIIDVSGPLLLPALLSPWTLMLALPLFLQHLLSSSPGQQILYHFYGNALAVFVFIAAIDGFSKMQTAARARLLWVFIVGLAFFNGYYMNAWKVRVPLAAPQLLQAQKDLLALIPKEAGALCSYRYLPALSARKDLYIAGKTTIYFTKNPQTIPESVHYALIDFQDLFDNKITLRNQINSPKWRVVQASGPIVLLRNDITTGPKLITFNPNKAGNEQSPLALKDIKLPVSIPASSKSIPITLQWQTGRPSVNGGALEVNFEHNGQTIDKTHHQIAYGLPMVANEMVTETFFCPLENLPIGKYSVRFQFLDRDNDYRTSQPITRTLTITP